MGAKCCIDRCMIRGQVRTGLGVCVCVCVRARACVCVCVCVQFVPMFSSTNKTSRSGVLFVSEGQYVGSPVDRYVQLCFVMDCSKLSAFWSD